MQSARKSLEEVIVGTVIGFIGSMFINYAFMPIFFGVQPSLASNAGMILVFTVWSVVRGYCLRRWYNRKGQK